MALHGKRAGTIVHSEAPFNAEPSREVLAESSLTPVDAFYARNHGQIQPADPESWRLEVTGLVDEELELSFSDLRDGRFPPREVVATLQCAGNRREGLLAVRDIPGEVPWGPCATGTAEWHGVALADVLAAARPASSARFVAFIGRDISVETSSPERYGASIPRRKAEREEVTLAWGMNRSPLPAVHGGPLRVIVPGYIGARSVKWLTRIELRDSPWEGFFQSTVYRMLPADGTPAPGAGFALGEVALNADILAPADGDTLPGGPVGVRGYAFAGGERHVARVDVSIDGGRSWEQAELLEDLGRWAWRMWRAQVDLASGSHEIVVRAWDSAAAAQPEHPAPLWNPKGYVNNSWGRVRVHVA